MTLFPVLIHGAWRPSGNTSGVFQAENPSNKQRIPGEFPVSGEADLEEALAAAGDAARRLRDVPPDALADFLDGYANEIGADLDELARIASEETALPIEPRLKTVELPRTMDQLRKAGAAARERSWRRATIDTAIQLRSQLEPLGGAVVVFGPNNFPFAYNAVSGGDFAAAIAAGNPVIAKGHPCHPHTTRRLAEAAWRALQRSALPAATVQLVYDTPLELGLRLVSHPATSAIGFTGSRPSGLALKAAADKAGKPIYLEMSSINPVFVLERALKERSGEISDQLLNSCLLGSGQFCTKPGMIVLLANAAGQDFARDLAGKFAGRASANLLTSRGPQILEYAVKALREAGAELLTGGQIIDRTGYAFANTLLSVSGEQFLRESKHLQTEAFGNACLIVLADGIDQMVEIAGRLEGNLTGSIYSEIAGGDDEAYRRLEPVLRTRVGRLLNDKMPTGVAVAPAMNHGGPFPATGHPGFTAVGFPASLLRFSALRCYDNVRPHRLPTELRDDNPTGKMWRMIDGEWTQRSVGAR